MLSNADSVAKKDRLRGREEMGETNSPRTEVRKGIESLGLSIFSKAIFNKTKEHFEQIGIRVQMIYVGSLTT